MPKDDLHIIQIGIIASIHVALEANLEVGVVNCTTWKIHGIFTPSVTSYISSTNRVPIAVVCSPLYL